MTRAQLERLTNDCLAGKAEGGTGGFKAKDAQALLEARVKACWRVAGQSPGALATSDPARYERWLRGNRAALLRESLIQSGEMSSSHVARLKKRESYRRQGRDLDPDDRFDAEHDPYVPEQPAFQFAATATGTDGKGNVFP